MNLSERFKFVWWICLTLGSTLLVLSRFVGNALNLPQNVEIILVLFWLSLLITPLFAEISMWGMSLKQSMTANKDPVKPKRSIQLWQIILLLSLVSVAVMTLAWTRELQAIRVGPQIFDADGRPIYGIFLTLEQANLQRSITNQRYMIWLTYIVVGTSLLQLFNWLHEHRVRKK